MMGVYIEGFQLPEKSDMYYVKVECEAGKNPVATIWRKDLLGEMSFGAFEVIPVTPHGDLIERDALTRAQGFRDYKYENGLMYVEVGEVVSLINAAPTIIPAEEEAHDRT